MQAGPSRYVSVSELYSTDEVELLLDEIRELEPTSCRGEDVQDFEIAGSGAGAAGGRSPVGTEHSWDSHAHYTRAPPPPPRPLAPLYCHLRHLLTLTGFCTLLIVLCSVSACGCVWASVGMRAGLLPLASRVRLLLFAALTSALLHAALLFMHISHLIVLLPIDWNKLALWSSIWSAASLTCGGSLTLHAVTLEPDYRWAPIHIADLLIAAASLGVCGALVALVVVCAETRAWRGECAARAGRSPRAAYRAVPAAPPACSAPCAAPQPSTSRDDPL